MKLRCCAAESWCDETCKALVSRLTLQEELFQNRLCSAARNASTSATKHFKGMTDGFAKLHRIPFGCRAGFGELGCNGTGVRFAPDPVIGHV
jgi:hypothetical protein